MERYTQVNAEFQRVARRGKALYEQCQKKKKKKEENNKMGKTRDLVKKIGDIKGTFHARMGTRKNRNSKALTEAEKIKRVARIHRRNILKRS